MNFNLWAEHTEKNPEVALDVGVMLLPKPSESSTTPTVGTYVKGISFYCPFSVDDKSCTDLIDQVDARTIGAIFNDQCKSADSDNKEWKEVTLQNGSPCEEFYFCKCKRTYHDEDSGTTIEIDVPKDVPQPWPVYFRFRLRGEGIRQLLTISHSKDQLLTSAFSKEEVVDFRFNDYRTLDDDTVRSKLDENAKGCVPVDGKIPIHFLLMSHATVDVDSGDVTGLKERRLLEEEIWDRYAPNWKHEETGIFKKRKNHQPDKSRTSLEEVTAWHWKKTIDKPSDGYKMYLRLRLHVSNYGTIARYLVILFFITVVFDSLEQPLFALCKTIFNLLIDLVC
ncbi:hypothetical protein [Bifidobacterium oedipodis]|nr:hypothetical protein [Bifidobacterium sp. DSM 109957]